MKVFFLGGTQSNSGPSNVNKNIIENASERICYLKSRNKWLRYIEAILKVSLTQVTVVSGVSRIGRVCIAYGKLLGKKSAFIMHGCGAYEVIVNDQTNHQKGVEQERYLMKHADLLLPVSEKFMFWVQQRYPEYAYKTKYLYNGIDVHALNGTGTAKKVPGSIAASGADRGVKNNLVVAQAVEKMDGRAYLDVFGHIYHSAPAGFQHTKYVGPVSHNEYMRRLGETEVFVLNSIFETFSISAVEALQCGCSVLLSEAAGITGILELEENDLIHDPMDEEEIRRKIEYLLENPNNNRILSKLDPEEYSWKKQVERLEDLCMTLLKH